MSKIFSRCLQTPLLTFICWHSHYISYFATCLRRCCAQLGVFIRLRAAGESKGASFAVRSCKLPISALYKFTADSPLLCKRIYCFICISKISLLSCKMGLSPEAIIGLVTLFVTCSPFALLLYSWICRRKKKAQETGMT